MGYATKGVWLFISSTDTKNRAAVYVDQQMHTADKTSPTKDLRLGCVGEDDDDDDDDDA